MRSGTLHSRARVLLAPVACAALSLPAAAFPPYRSTDADTADAYVLQLRLGLAELERDGGATHVTSPALNANLGLPRRLEIVTETEYRPERAELGNGAAGVKWVAVAGEDFSFGIETLALLPVRPGDRGLGVESTLVATFWRDSVQVHVNAGGFDDTRTGPAASGWEASVLAEFPRGAWRPGIELAGGRETGESTEAVIGLGSIREAGRFTIRIGLHAGLTGEAPEVAFNLWFTTELPLSR